MWEEKTRVRKTNRKTYIVNKIVYHNKLVLFVYLFDSVRAIKVLRAALGHLVIPESKGAQVRTGTQDQWEMLDLLANLDLWEFLEKTEL